jgi:hypothetical protein
MDAVFRGRKPILAMIENYRSELVWCVMRGDPYLRQGLERAGFWRLARKSSGIDVCRSVVLLRESGVLRARNARLTTNALRDTMTSNAMVEMAAAISARA